jgi:hypothetical protein
MKMTGQDWVDLTCDYLISKKPPEFTKGVEPLLVRERIENEINAMTRIEYLRVLGDSEDIKLFHEKQKLAKGETITKIYTATVIEEPETTK